MANQQEGRLDQGQGSADRLPVGSIPPGALVVSRRARRVIRLGIITAWLAWAGCFIGMLLIIRVDVESVLVTGPIILVLGVIGLVCGLGRYARLALLSAANCGIVILFFSLVIVLDWSPSDAEHPFAIMSALFTALTLPVAISVSRHMPIQDPWTCSVCGYLLYGLTIPRCPECGTAFDALLLATDRNVEIGDDRMSTGQG